MNNILPNDEYLNYSKAEFNLPKLIKNKNNNSNSEYNTILNNSPLSTVSPPSNKVNTVSYNKYTPGDDIPQSYNNSDLKYKEYINNKLNKIQNNIVEETEVTKTLNNIVNNNNNNANNNSIGNELMKIFPVSIIIIILVFILLLIYIITFKE